LNVVSDKLNTMRDDFIRDKDLEIETSVPQEKHRALFRMSDLAQLRGLTALRNSLVSVLPLAVISTILYIAVAIQDLIAKPELLNAITALSSGVEDFDIEPSMFLSMPYIAPYLTFCGLIPIMFAIAFTYYLSKVYRSGDAIPLALISGVVTFIALYSPLFVTHPDQISIMEFPINLMKSNPGLLSGGVFVGLLVALVNYGFYRLFSGKGISTPLPVNVSEALQGGFRVVLPGAFTTLIVIALAFLVHEPFGNAIYHSTRWMTDGLSGVYALLIIVLLVQVFAFFGIIRCLLNAIGSPKIIKSLAFIRLGINVILPSFLIWEDFARSIARFKLSVDPVPPIKMKKNSVESVANPWSDEFSPQSGGSTEPARSKTQNIE